MKMTPKKANKYAISMFVAVIIILLGGAYILAEPLQLYFIKKGEQPSFGLTILLDLAATISVSFLTYVGFSFSTLSYQKWSEMEDFQWKDIWNSNNYWKWIVAWFVCFTIVLFGFWRADLP